DCLLAEARVRRQAEIVVRRKIDGRPAIDHGVSALLLVEHAQRTKDTLALEGIDLDREIREGIGALGGHHAYHSIATLRTPGEGSFRTRQLPTSNSQSPTRSRPWELGV